MLFTDFEKWLRENPEVAGEILKKTQSTHWALQKWYSRKRLPKKHMPAILRIYQKQQAGEKNAK